MRGGHAAAGLSERIARPHVAAGGRILERVALSIAECRIGAEKGVRGGNGEAVGRVVVEYRIPDVDIAARRYPKAAEVVLEVDAVDRQSIERFKRQRERSASTETSGSSST